MKVNFLEIQKLGYYGAILSKPTFASGVRPMRVSSRHHLVILFVALALDIVIPRSGHAQGFGMIKDTVTLRRKLPAIFILKGTEVSVRVTSAVPNTAQLALPLGPLIETSLQQSDHRITAENAKPQTLIECTIIAYTPPRTQQITVGTVVQTKKGPIQPRKYQKVTGELDVAYRATDALTHKPLDAAIIKAKFDQDYEENGEKTKSMAETVDIFKHGLPKPGQEETIPTPDQTNQKLTQQIASMLAARVVNTDESIQVQLAKVKSEDASRLAHAGQWPKMQEELEMMPPFPKESDDAYRLYNIGVAYEAMGYSAPDPVSAVKMFNLAAINYGKAKDANPTEKYFIEPQTRIETALVTMKTIEERAKNGGQPTTDELADTQVVDPSGGISKPKLSSADNSTSSSLAPANSAEAGDPDTLNNQAIIDFAKGGMDDDNLISNIREAKKVDFDLSISGQKQLMAAKVSNRVLAAMRQRSHPATSPRVGSRPTPASSKPTGGNGQ